MPEPEAVQSNPSGLKADAFGQIDFPQDRKDLPSYSVMLSRPPRII